MDSSPTVVVVAAAAGRGGSRWPLLLGGRPRLESLSHSVSLLITESNHDDEEDVGSRTVNSSV